MEEMKWFSSALLSVLAPSNFGFCLALAGIFQTFGEQQCRADHSVSTISQTEPSQHCGADNTLEPHRRNKYV
jgi:hypothetical protein